MSVIAAFTVPHPPIIMNAVGHGEEKKIQDTINAYDEVAVHISKLKPDTIVLISPHSIMYQDYFHISPGANADGDMGRFGAKQVKISAEYDEEFVHKLSLAAKLRQFPAGTQGERGKALDHGTLVPLYFVNKQYSNYKLVRIGLSGLSPLTHYELGRMIKETAEELDRRTVVIASSDLSHKLSETGPYGFAEQGPKFDSYIKEALSEGDFLKVLETPPELSEAAAECGLRSLQIMAGSFDGYAVESKVLSYEGTFGVGYLVATFIPKGQASGRDIGSLYEKRAAASIARRRESEDCYVRLARICLETYVKTGNTYEFTDDVPPELMSRRAGVFVSLKKYGQLRGCIGTIAPTTKNIACEIRNNALSAGLNDPRFDPVEADELENLVYSVDVLGEPEKIADKAALDVKKYGVIVQKGSRRGLLLPDLDGVDTVDDQINIAKRKAGLSDDDDVTLFRFEVVRHI